MTKLNFEKYHGLGNDFIIFMYDDVKDFEFDKLAQKVCNRQTGIGADGMMIVKKKSDDLMQMIFINADGSEAPMCGNGVRCFSHFVYEHKLLTGNLFNIETLAGLMKIEINISNNIFTAKVNMGKPNFLPEKIPMNTLNKILENKKEFINEKLEFKNLKLNLSSVFIGTTHTVIYVDKLENINMPEIGREVENYLELYPKKTNVNFVEIKDRKNIKMLTWERGVGMTLACGTGACASVLIGNLKMKTLENKVNVELPIGNLLIEVGQDENIYMTGPSEKIAKGEYYYEKI